MPSFKLTDTTEEEGFSSTKNVLPEGTYSASLSKADNRPSEAGNDQVVLDLLIIGDSQLNETVFTDRPKSAYCSFPDNGEQWDEWVCNKSANTLKALLGEDFDSVLDPGETEDEVAVNTERAKKLLNRKLGTIVLFDVKYRKGKEPSDFPSNIRIVEQAPNNFAGSFGG